jgi:hypothetical protein
MEGSRVTVAPLLLAGTLGCLSAPLVDRSLYPPQGEPLARNQIAELVGPILTVDGQDVAQDPSRFELLPGCHVIRTHPVTDVGSSRGRPYRVPGATLTLQMKPGYAYVFRTGFGPGGRGTAPIAIEEDETGSEVRTIHPGRDRDDREACREARAPR